MGVALTVKVECSFDGGGSWTDVTTDVRATDVIRFRRGLSDSWITDRIAPVGQLQLTFDNRAQRYSPDSSNARAGFGIGTPIRVALASPVLPNRTFYAWRGRITAIVPEPGLLGRRTHITAHDWFEEAVHQPTPRLPVMTDVRGDEVVGALLAASPRPPRAIALMTGSDLLPVALDASPSERGNLYTELARLTLTEVGYCYLRGDEAGGETFVWENRRHRPKQTSDLGTFVDNQRGLSLAREAEQLVNEVAVSAVPSRADTTPVVLYSLPSATQLRAGIPLTFDAPYRDPTQRAERVGGRHMVTPVAGTDYLVNSAADGSGTDLTSQATVTAIFWATSARVTVTCPVDAYLTKLQLRGEGLYRYERAWAVATAAESQAIYGIRETRLDLPYQADVQTAQAVANYLLLMGRTPRTLIGRLELLPQVDEELMRQALLRDISDRIRVAESASGVSGAHYIQAVEWTISAGPVAQVTWTLAPSSGLAFWRLGVSGKSELGQRTWLGPAIAHGDISHQDHTDSSHTDTAHGDGAHTDVAHSDVPHSDTAHGDTAHADSHGDTPHGDSAHNDVAHSDVPHSDTAHGDTAHADSHGDTPHGDSAHDDAGHSDSHSDAPHADAPHDDYAHTDTHSDTAHADAAHADSHADTSHMDGHDDWHVDEHFDAGIPKTPDHDDFHSDLHTDAHSDVPHDDAHADISHSDAPHDDSHTDVPHTDTAHTDTAHGDSHADTAHGDSAHNDAAHSDSHTDTAHTDTAHGDSHTDVPHGDSAHTDVAHSDVPHSDTAHGDTAHADSHGDTPHGDSAHNDVAHNDSHSDAPHADVQHVDD